MTLALHDEMRALVLDNRSDIFQCLSKCVNSQIHILIFYRGTDDAEEGRID
jgi:hypothetical protein